jgi:deoxyribonucleoside regulator
MALDPNERYYIKLKASYLYYYEDLTQKQVADQLNVSRPTLNKLLKEAKQEGMVKVEIYDHRNYSHLIELENQLCAKFGLKDVKLVDCFTENENIIKDRISKAAATYFDKLMKSGIRVGIGWGKTLETMAKNINPVKSVKDAEFVTLLGGSGNLDYQIHANGMTEEIAKKYYNSITHHIYAPIFSADESLSMALFKDEGIKKVMNKMQDLDLAIIGIDGDLTSSTTLMTGSIPKKYIDVLQTEKAVGNICARFYDIKGNICAKEMNDRLISIPLDVLKNTPSIMAVAGGINKVESMVGAAKGGYYNILITDENTAKSMLEF